MVNGGSTEASTLTFTIASTLGEVGPAVDRVIEFCKTEGAQTDRLEDVAQKLELSVTEAITNIVKHAYGPQDNGPIEISIQSANDRITVVLRDEGVEIPDGIDHLGNGFSLGDEFEDLPEGGMGWFLIKSDMDQVTYARTGHVNELVLVKYI
jgi:serine/threonine-protein kinase RsbW